MTIETPAPTDLTTRLQAAACAAIADVAPTIEAAGKSTRRLTFEIQLSGGVVKGAHCWIERGCNINRLLGVNGRG